MKLFKPALAALLLTVFMQQTMAAEEITNTAGKVKMGEVSASDALTLDELVNALSEKADAQGASAFKVLSTTGQNKLHGVADIYK